MMKPHLALAGIVFGIGVLVTISATYPSSAEPEPPAPTPVPADHSQPAPVHSYATGGPYIGEDKALDVAKGFAETPVAREAVGFMTYGAAMEWMGSGVGTIDRAREVYLTVLEAQYTGQRGIKPVTCSWFFVVVDATTGDVRSIGCTDFSKAWPDLPSTVRE